MIKLKRNSYVGRYKMHQDLKYLKTSRKNKKVKIVLKFKKIEERENGNVVCLLQLVKYSYILADLLLTYDYDVPEHTQIIKTYTVDMIPMLQVLKAQIDGRSLKNKMFVFDMVDGMPTNQILPHNLVYANQLNPKQVHNHKVKPGPKKCA